MKAALEGVHLHWSRFRVQVGEFTLCKRVVAVCIAIAFSFSLSIAHWGFFDQQGVWIGSLFFRKVSDNRYEASAFRNPEINSQVTLELEPNDGYRIKWNGYEWFGRMTNDHLVDDHGNIIPVKQMPFWQKEPSISRYGEEYHEPYFMWKLLAIRIGELEPLGYARIPYFLVFALIICLFRFLFPDVVHRIRGFVSNDYTYKLNEEERLHIRFTAFVGSVLLLIFEVFYVTQSIISNWV